MTGDGAGGERSLSSLVGRLPKPILWVAGAIAVGFLGAVGAWGWSLIQGRLPEGDPLIARLELHDEIDCPVRVLSRSELSELDASEEFDDEWAEAHGGVSYWKAQSIEVTIQGLVDDAVIVDEIVVLDVEKRPLPEGAVVARGCGPQGGGVEIRHSSIDITSTPPGVDHYEDDGWTEETDFAYWVSRAEIEKLEITVGGEFAGDEDGIYEWHLGLHWSSGDRSGILRLTQADEPMVSAVVGDQIEYLTRTEDGEWLPDP